MRCLATLGFVFVLALVGCKSRDAHLSHEQVSSALRDSLATLEQISRRPSDTIPDEVLNQTRCVIVVPHVTGVANRMAGLASCRMDPDRWTIPSVVTFSGSVGVPVRAGDRDLLALVVGAGAADRLRRGELKVDAQNAMPGMTAAQVQNVSNVRVPKDVVVYVREATSLAGTQASGTVATDEATRLLTGGKTGSNVGVADEYSGATRTFLSVLTSFFNTITPMGIIIHHSGVIPATDKPPSDPREVDEFHAQRGFASICFGREYHVAYHYLIGRNGDVQEGRPEHCHGAHALAYNSYLGIVLFGDFSSKDNPHGEKGPNTPTAQQMKSLIALCRRLRTKYHIPLKNVLRHSDVSKTDCPGDRLPFEKVVSQLGP